MVRVGINGLGVMGRAFIRALQNEINEGLNPEEVKVVALNDLFNTKNLASLLAHDSIYLGFPGKVETDLDSIIVNGQRICKYSLRNPSEIPWGDSKVDIVLESTGYFVTNTAVQAHLEGGASKVIISGPGEHTTKTIIPGLNDDMYKGEDIISASSDILHCLAPLVKVLNNSFGIDSGIAIVIEPYRTNQRLVDGYHEDISRAYAAPLNSTPLSLGDTVSIIHKVLPGLESKLTGTSIRVPLAVGSIVDFVVKLNGKYGIEEVNKALRAAADGDLKGTLEYREGPIVSSMVIGKPTPSIVDASQTNIRRGNLLQVIAFYDNVMSYAHQLLRLTQIVGNYKG